MTRLLTLLSFLVSTIALSQEKSTYQCHFETGLSTLSKTETDSLQAWFKTLPPNAVFTVEGHTDKVGSVEANALLSQKRGALVKKLLEAFGANRDSIEVRAFGESKPIVTNGLDEDILDNRRVTITATYPTDTSSIWQLFSLLDEGYQTFEINPAKDTLIKGKQGTFIKIPANAFRLPSGCRSSNVTIRLKEAYKTSDMLMANLSTTSNGEILETRGMTYLDALCGTTPLKLAPKKKITHVMPIEDPVADMKFFSGNFPDPHSAINWSEERNADLGALPSDLMLECCVLGFRQDCPLFFCKIKNLFTRSGISRSRNREGFSCNEIASRIEEMGLTYEEGLQVLFNQYNVSTTEELLIAFEEEEKARREEAIKSGTASSYDYSNYIFNQTKLGWANCDIYAKVPDWRLITLNIETPNNPQNQSFLVFKRRRIIIRNNGIDSKMKSQTFTGIPKGKEAIIISLKYSMGQVYIASKEITTDDAHIKLDFRPVTIEELKTEIQKLN